MRRNFACVLVLGIAGLGGIGVMRGIAQSEAPVLQPEQLKPANYAYPKNAASSPSGETNVRPDVKALAPDIIDPLVPPAPDSLPLLVPTQPVAMPSISMPKDDKPVMAPNPVLPPAPAQMLPPAVDPHPAAIKAPVISLPPVDPKTNSDVPFTNTVPPGGDSVRTTAPAGSANGNRVAPSVSIETVAPETVPFGQPVTYEIVVKNTGTLPVTHIRVDEEIGAGSKFISSEPAGEINGDKVLWMLGSLNVGEEKRIKMTVKPGDGDLATKPRVAFAAGTAMHVQVTRPNLVMTVSASEIVQVGDELPVQIQVKNVGTGEAAKIVLKAVLSDGLKHGEGNDIQAALNKLSPGESQVVTLRVQAASPGPQVCTLFSMTDGAAKATSQIKVDVRQPKLTLALSGPNKCMVRAEPTFALEVANPGTSATEPVQVAVAFPEGLDYSTASDGGAYDPSTRSVSWNLGTAEPGTKRTLTVKAKSTLAGHMGVRAVAQAGTKLNARAEATIQADGVPALLFEVSDLEDPVEVGKEATYEIRLSNTGTMNCTNVRLGVAMSEGLVPTAVSSTVPQKIVGQTMVFDPIAKLPVKGEPLIIRVKAKGTTAGDHRFKVQLSCDQMKQPVVKEESTSFFQP